MDGTGSLLISAFRALGGYATIESLQLETGHVTRNPVEAMLSRLRRDGRVGAYSESGGIGSPQLNEWRTVHGNHGKYYVFRPRTGRRWGGGEKLIYVLRAAK